MFGRYALAVGRGAHRHALGARATELGLPVRIETPELLLIAPSDATFLHDGEAILAGQIFNCANERLTSLPQQLARANSANLRQSVEGHWGSYAFFFASSGEVGAYREPSGSVPVYRTGDADQTVFVSDASLAMRLGLIQEPQIDQRFLVHWLQFPFLRTRRTGLSNVTELPPGMLLSRKRLEDWREIRVWHPSTFVRPGQAISDAGEAASQLRRTALSVISAQPVGAGSVLRLSGGLDSSIIAACLSKAGREFSCINFATRSRDGDERDYARDVAKRFALNLVEVGEPDVKGLFELSQPPSFRPTVNPLLAPFERAIGQAAVELGASLLIDGGGGDNLFCSITTASPVIDALRHGSLRQAAATVSDIGMRADCTIWEVIRAAAHRLSRSRRPWTQDRSYILQEALLGAPEQHPWLVNLKAPPGKREHVEALVHIQHFLDRSASPIAMLHPLLAQPLLELCLRIPSWLWMHGGRDRAIAREAFVGLVPHSVLQRRVKGSLQSLLYRSFAKLREQMRELLVGGELTRSGIIDPHAITEALTNDAWTRDEAQLRISEMVALELWMRSWRSQPSNASSGS